MAQQGSNQTLGGGGFHHVAINTRDFDRSVAFYKEVLGFVTKIAWGDAGNRAIMLDTGDGNYLELFERPDMSPAPQTPMNGQVGMIHFAFRTSDTDGVLDRARKAGAPIEMEPKALNIQTTEGDGPVPVRIAFFRGPDGEVVELFQNQLT